VLGLLTSFDSSHPLNLNTYRQPVLATLKPAKPPQMTSFPTFPSISSTVLPPFFDEDVELRKDSSLDLLSSPVPTFPGAKISSGSSFCFPGGEAKMSSGGLSNTLTVGVGWDWDFGPDPTGCFDEKMSSLFLDLVTFLFPAKRSSSNMPFCFVLGNGAVFELNKSFSIEIPVFLEDEEELKRPSSVASGLGRLGDLGSKTLGLAALEPEPSGLEEELEALDRWCLDGGFLLGPLARPYNTTML